PLHRLRLARRRFNQSALLAKALSGRCGVPMEAHALLRSRRTPTQGGLSAAGRRRNVQGAFEVAQPDRVMGRRLVLIDDVMTTGATLESCARTLKRAGAVRVDCLCLARVVKARPAP
ncbi:MAG: phosphoribosyltransferase family protein, partial [Litorimonas sp.]